MNALVPERIEGDIDDEIAELRFEALLTKKENEAEVSSAHEPLPNQRNLTNATLNQPLSQFQFTRPNNRQRTSFPSSGNQIGMNHLTPYMETFSQQMASNSVNSSNIVVLTTTGPAEPSNHWDCYESKGPRGRPMGKGFKKRGNFVLASQRVSSQSSSHQSAPLLVLPQDKYAAPSKPLADSSVNGKTKMSARMRRLQGSASDSEDSESDSSDESSSNSSSSESSSSSSESSSSSDSESDSDSINQAKKSGKKKELESQSHKKLSGGSDPTINALTGNSISAGNNKRISSPSLKSMPTETATKPSTGKFHRSLSKSPRRISPSFDRQSRSPYKHRLLSPRYKKFSPLSPIRRSSSISPKRYVRKRSLTPRIVLAKRSPLNRKEANSKSPISRAETLSPFSRSKLSISHDASYKHLPRSPRYRSRSPLPFRRYNSRSPTANRRKLKHLDSKSPSPIRRRYVPNSPSRRPLLRNRSRSLTPIRFLPNSPSRRPPLRKRSRSLTPIRFRRFFGSRSPSNRKRKISPFNGISHKNQSPHRIKHLGSHSPIPAMTSKLSQFSRDHPPRSYRSPVKHRSPDIRDKFRSYAYPKSPNSRSLSPFQRPLPNESKIHTVDGASRAVAQNSTEPFSNSKNSLTPYSKDLSPSPRMKKRNFASPHRSWTPPNAKYSSKFQPDFLENYEDSNFNRETHLSPQRKPRMFPVPRFEPIFRGPRPNFNNPSPFFNAPRPNFPVPQSNMYGFRPDIHRPPPNIRGPPPNICGPPPNISRPVPRMLHPDYNHPPLSDSTEGRDMRSHAKPSRGGMPNTRREELGPLKNNLNKQLPPNRMQGRITHSSHFDIDSSNKPPFREPLSDRSYLRETSSSLPRLSETMSNHPREALVKEIPRNQSPSPHTRHRITQGPKTPPDPPKREPSPLEWQKRKTVMHNSFGDRYNRNTENDFHQVEHSKTSSSVGTNNYVHNSDRQHSHPEYISRHEIPIGSLDEKNMRVCRPISPLREHQRDVRSSFREHPMSPFREHQRDIRSIKPEELHRDVKSPINEYGRFRSNSRNDRSPIKDLQRDHRPPLKEYKRNLSSPVKEPQRAMRSPLKDNQRDARSPNNACQREARSPLKQCKKELRSPLRGSQRPARSPYRDVRLRSPLRDVSSLQKDAGSPYRERRRDERSPFKVGQRTGRSPPKDHQKDTRPLHSENKKYSKSQLRDNQRNERSPPRDNQRGVASPHRDQQRGATSPHRDQQRSATSPHRDQQRSATSPHKDRQRYAKSPHKNQLKEVKSPHRDQQKSKRSPLLEHRKKVNRKDNVGPVVSNNVSDRSKTDITKNVHNYSDQPSQDSQEMRLSKNQEKLKSGRDSQSDRLVRKCSRESDRPKEENKRLRQGHASLHKNDHQMTEKSYKDDHQEQSIEEKHHSKEIIVNRPKDRRPIKDDREILNEKLRQNNDSKDQKDELLLKEKESIKKKVSIVPEKINSKNRDKEKSLNIDENPIEANTTPLIEESVRSSEGGALKPPNVETSLDECPNRDKKKKREKRKDKPKKNKDNEDKKKKKKKHKDVEDKKSRRKKKKKDSKKKHKNTSEDRVKQIIIKRPKSVDMTEPAKEEKDLRTTLGKREKRDRSSSKVEDERPKKMSRVFDHSNYDHKLMRHPIGSDPEFSPLSSTDNSPYYEEHILKNSLPEYNRDNDELLHSDTFRHEFNQNIKDSHPNVGEVRGSKFKSQSKRGQGYVSVTVEDKDRRVTAGFNKKNRNQARGSLTAVGNHGGNITDRNVSVHERLGVKEVAGGGNVGGRETNRQIVKRNKDFYRRRGAVGGHQHSGDRRKIKGSDRRSNR